MKSGDVKIEVEVLKDGRVGKLTVVKSSGDDAIDQAPGKGLAAAVPFPVFPSAFKGDSVTFRMRFRYNPALTDKP